jgi:uncharacterized protein (DUF2252 family)
VAQREQQGRVARERTPRAVHSVWEPAPDRPDPVALLESQRATRLPDLVPLRYGRMVASPFAFLRGAAIVMANDLARTPSSGLTVQLCGDCHLANFGVYASPERAMLFDLNDFDETLPGPFEWDIKRLATSFVVAARSNGFSGREARRAAQVAVLSYRETMLRFAGMRELELWYHRVEAEQLLEMLGQIASRRIEKAAKAGMAKARRKDSLQALEKLTVETAEGRRFRSDPPLLVPMPAGAYEERIREEFRTYRESLQEDRRELLMRYRIADIARKIVGVGSVGTRAYVVLLLGRDAEDPLFLQVKQANRSVLEPHLPRSRYANQGHRVVVGQRLLQAASDIFLGWNTGADGHDYYWRQLRDMKGSTEVGLLGPDGLKLYAAICGGALARAHARSGDRIAIAAYLGKGERFDEAVTAFAEQYADQTERDHAALAIAVKEGRIVAEIESGADD